MSFNVPEAEKSAFNKETKKALDVLASDVGGTLIKLKSYQPETLVESYGRPLDEPVARDLSPLEQYFYMPQPVAEVEDLTVTPQRESMVVPQDQPRMLSNLVNQYQTVGDRDMVGVTPYEQAVIDASKPENDSLRDESGGIVTSPLDVFSKPLSADKIKALGYVDSDMKPTEKGELFYNLVGAGMFDDDGIITEKGRAYMTPTEDVGKPENLKAFKILWDDEVIRPNASFGEMAAETVGLLKDAAIGGTERIGQEAQSLWHNSQTWSSLFGQTDRRPKELRDKMTASGLGVIEGAVENIAGWAGMADVGAAWIGEKLYDILPAGMEAEAEQAMYSARQRQWKTQQDMANLEAGEIAETVLGFDNMTKTADAAKSSMGAKAFDKQYKRAGAFAQIAADPSNLLPGAVAVKAARTAPLANRLSITAQKRMAQIAAKDLAIAEGRTAVETANAVLAKESATVAVANRLSSDIASRVGADPSLVMRSNQASAVASRITQSADQIRSTLPKVTSELDSLIAQRNGLATRIPEAYAQKTLQTMEAGRKLRALPAKALGVALERVGNTISKIDDAATNFLQERGLDQMYTAAVGAAGVVGLAGSPIVGAIAGGAAVLKAGKALSNYGKLFRYVGKEMEAVRGQIPFWKRVAAHTAPGSLNRGIAHTFNTFDLGGATSDVLRRVGRGATAAAPADLMFEYLSDGADMRPETLYRAASESLVIGGSFAAAGGAFMGTNRRMRELSIGDELNFRRDITDAKQKALFEEIPSSTRRSISTYAIANPTLNYLFKDSGASRYDPNTNTAVINVRSTNPIKALVAHETLHHTIIKNNMESGISALFLGDIKENTVGGLFRSRDGKLDPNFEAFKDAYYKRLGAEGMTDTERDAIYSLDKVAVEYFIEKHADQYSAMAESGELGAVSGGGAFKRKLGGILETILPRIPVLKDLNFKSGGAIDANGSWVTGNGLLGSEGVKSDPIAAKMFREMNRRSSGLAPGQFDPLMSDKPDSGAPILLDPASGIDAELLHPLVNVDNDGRPIMQGGKPVAIDKATELSRALAGLTAVEVLRRKKAENYAPEKGEASVDDNGEFQPGWLSNDVLSEMFAKNKYNPEQKRIIREVNKLIRNGNGDRMVMINFPATTRNRAGKAVYKPQGATLRDTVPVSVAVSKAGNLLFGLMSVTKLHENIQKRSQSKRGKKLYGGNVDLILRDTQAMMQFHKDGIDSIEHFKAKYGAVEATERKNFINTMFGLLNQKEQAVLNPVLLEDGVRSKDNVYRTYRADRVSKAVPMSPQDYPAMPFSYEAVSQVKMPEPKEIEKRVAFDQDQAKKAQTNGNQPTTIQAQPSGTGTSGSKATGEGFRQQGGLPRGVEQLQPQNRPGDQGLPLAGLPATVTVPGIGKYTFGPNKIARNVAAEYARSVGIDYNPPTTYTKVDAERATRIAGEYEKMVHDPNDPKVKESYDSMIKETLDQWEAIKKTGLKVEPIPAGAKDPYAASPRLAIIDVKDNNHLWFFPTNSGFGGTESAGVDVSGNPLMSPTGEVLNGHTMLANDVFRIVHDYFGHIKEGVGFRADGEENAWRSHSAMYSDKARPAMTAETRGQNSWVNFGPFAEFNKTASGSETQYAPQKTGIMPEWVMSEGASDAVKKDVRYMPESVDAEDKGIQAPAGSLGELRKNVEIRKSDLPADAASIPKFVARSSADSGWKVMEGPLRIARGNYLTPLPNIKITKTKGFSVQNQDLIQNAFLAKSAPATTPKELREQQTAIYNTNDALVKIDSAIKDIESDPQKFVDPKGYAETMRKAGVTGDILIPPSSLGMMLNDPDSFAALLSGGYHGDKTVSGISEAAMSGLDSVVEMRQLIGGRPPDLVTAIHHLWGTLSKQLPPLQQEALWMRMITNEGVMRQIEESINGTYSQSPDQWKNTVQKARSSTVGNYEKLGNNATSNANSFYLMLYRHNGKWGEVSDVYKNDDPVQMRYAFNSLGHGATGIKNKVQSFIGLTFGIKGNVLDRWRFVDMYLADAMKITGANTARDYFKYEGKKKNVPVDKIGIYKNYGTIENKSPLFSLALYSAMDRVSQAAINASPSLQALLGDHADPGGLHWLSWNAIKNEAVGHSSLDITKNFIKDYAKGNSFDNLNVDNFMEFVNSTEAFVEGTSGGGEEVTRLTLKNGAFSYSKK